MNNNCLKFTFDIVKMIAYNKNIPIDEGNFGAINFNFAGLLEKLKDISQYIKYIDGVNNNV